MTTPPWCREKVVVYYYLLVYFDQDVIGRQNFFFFRAHFASFHTHASLLTFFILAVPMQECLGKHSFMSTQFPIAILNGISFILFGARDPPGGSGWIINVGDYADNSFTALVISDPGEVGLEL